MQNEISEPLLSLYKNFLNTTCQLPQITDEGLKNSQTHGKDLFSVYHELLNFIPKEYDSNLISFRVSTNPITSQVAGVLIKGMYPGLRDISVKMQHDVIDTLNSNYPCGGADNLRKEIENDEAWKNHLNEKKELFQKLDNITGIDPLNKEWHTWFDHYFDNLSFRFCHDLPYPCNKEACISSEVALEVFDVGNWEYNYIYTKSNKSILYSVARSLFLFEVFQNIQNKIMKLDSIKYRHNIAHDNTIASLLGALQITNLKWPGLGSEIVFELYRKENNPDMFFLRILYNGEPLQTSLKNINSWDMVPIDIFFQYIHTTFGTKGEILNYICNGIYH
ncbi:uncharacterized protein SAPINGB_P004785 [Magnusiomyces paraingens]|uniref:Acid phosphatase n=1 Tax=Magnusiomyces paraingens TaxID=2606893 RepID=A0A5E8BX96_9ASCO|nr:uncharacterized protein SAPINGB_P004785 [Saprochaete ingens]VVT56074.1 unnamed protein product [Saprochaete ingens]